MSRIEFLDEDGNVIQQTVVDDLTVKPKGTRTAFTETPRSERCVHLKCHVTESDLGVIREDGSVVLNIPGAIGPWLLARITSSGITGAMSAMDVLDVESWTWTGRQMWSQMASLPIPCVHCEEPHQLAAHEAAAAFSGFLATGRRTRLTI